MPILPPKLTVENTPFVIEDYIVINDYNYTLQHLSDYTAIRNGLFEIVQRGSSFTTLTNGQVTFDGWQVSYDGTSVGDYVDVTLDTNAPDIDEAGYHIPHAVKLDVTTAQASPSSTAYWTFYQPIEGYIWERLRGAPATLQFWARTDRSGGGRLSSNIRVSDGSMRYWNKSHVLTSDWQQFQMTFTTEEGWTENLTNSEGVRIHFSLVGGSTYTAADESWTTTVAWISDQTDNFLDSTSNNVWIADVRLVPGSGINTGPYPRSHEAEMALCERYYQTSYNHGVAEGTDTVTGLTQVTAGAVVGEQNQIPGTVWGTKMRTTPTVTLYSKGGTSGAVSDVSYTNFTTGCSLADISEHGFRAIVKATVFTTTKMINFHYAATAEL